MNDISQKKIQIVTEYIVKGQEKMKEINSIWDNLRNDNNKLTRNMVSNAMKQIDSNNRLIKQQKFIGEWSDKLGVNTNRVTRIMGNQGLVFNELGEVTDKAGRKVNDLGNAMIQGRRATQPFKMEMLSVMFTGYALQRVFGGILKEQMQLWGVSELLSASWKVTMIPIMDDLAPILYNILTYFMDLPEAIQKVEGAAVLAGYALSTAFYWAGQAGLAIQGFEKVGLIPVGFNLKDITRQQVMNALSKAARFASGGLALYFVYQGIKDADENTIKSMGELLMASSLAKYAIKGSFGKWGTAALGIGVTLVLVGDEETTVNIFKFMLKVGSTITNILGEAVKAGLSLGMYKPKFDEITNFKDAFKKAFEQVSIEQEGYNVFGLPKKVVYPIATINSLRKKWNDLAKEQIEATTRAARVSDEKAQEVYDSYSEQLDEIKLEIDSWVDNYEKANKAVSDNTKSTTNSIESSMLSLLNKNKLINSIMNESNITVTNNMQTAWNQTLDTNYSNISNYVDATTKELGKIPTNITTVHTTIEETIKQGEKATKGGVTYTKPKSVIGGLFSAIWNLIKLPFLQTGGFIEKTGAAVVHKGESVVPAGKNNPVVLNVSYNINVSDKKEMEKLIRYNNTQLVEEIKRQIAV